MELWDSFLARFGANRYVQSAVILALTLVASWAMERLLAFGLGRVARRTKSAVDDRLIELLRRPVRVSVVLAGLALVALRIDPSNLLRSGALDLTSLTLSLLATVAILIWMTTGVRIAALVLDAATDRKGLVQSRTVPLFRNLANVLVVGIAIYFVFVAWGIDVTAWLASAGIVGIAIGFAAKDTLANLFAGVFILTDAPYKVGDFLQLESGERGQVTRIGVRSTRILTRDDIEITIPNSVVADSRIFNESGGKWPKERLRIKLVLPYGIDLDAVRAQLIGIAKSEAEVCREPEPRFRVRGFGQLGIEVELLAWIEEPIERGRVADALYSAIYRRFLADAVDLPFAERAPAPWTREAAQKRTPPSPERQAPPPPAPVGEPKAMSIPT